MAYVIGTQKGKDIAENMKAGQKVTISDGSTWEKKSDGSISVTTSSGEKFDNTYKTTNNSPFTQGVYTIGSDAGKNQAQNMGVGTSWAATDGSVWTKEQDGTITVRHNGTETKNAWKPAGMVWSDNYNQMYQKPIQEQKDDPRIEEKLNKILNRDSFSYDVENDPLYQQYAQMYQREGDRAMRDTLAEAAAGAGGMNSYAITAAQQANNYYNAQLSDKIPELYQLAYEMYLNEKESEVQDLGLLLDMSDRQYNRYRDTINDWYKDKDFAYGVYRDDAADSQWGQSLAFENDWKNKDFNARQDQIALENGWREQEWDYKTSKEEQEQAREDAWGYINRGKTPPADLIAKTGWTQEYVDLEVAEKQAELNKTKSSGGGGNNYTPSSGGGNNNTPDGVNIPESELAKVMTLQEWSAKSATPGSDASKYSTYEEYCEAKLKELEKKYNK